MAVAGSALGVEPPLGIALGNVSQVICWNNPALVELVAAPSGARGGGVAAADGVGAVAVAGGGALMGTGGVALAAGGV